MDLFEETLNVNNKAPKEKNTTFTILSLITILVVMCIVIIGVIMYLQTTLLTVKINGVVSSSVKKMLVIDESKTNVYAPIKRVASYLGYEAYAGDYINKSEDENMCYIQSDNVVAIFTKDSKDVQMIDLSNNKRTYSTVTLDNAIQEMNGELYISSSDMEKTFYLKFQYDNVKNKINIYTLPYLVSTYQTTVTGYGYKELSTDFVNERAILDNILIVGTENNTTKVEKWGAISIETGKIILETKYDNIQYIPEDKNFFVTSDKKIGIISASKETKIEMKYDSLVKMGENSGLYKATLNGKVGVIDEKGNILINLENQAVGIDITQYESTGITDGNILLSKVIPVEKEGLWGLFDLKGNVIVDYTYKSIGCVATAENATSLLVIPDYQVIVVQGQNGMYSLVTSTGDQLFSFVLTDIYKQVTDGTSYYYMTVQGKKLNVDQFVKKQDTTNNNQSTNKITTEAKPNNNSVDITDNSSNTTNTTNNQ